VNRLSILFGSVIIVLFILFYVGVVGMLFYVWRLPKIEVKDSVKVYPVRGYTKGLLSFVDRELCDYFFEEYSDGTVRVKKLGCIKADVELINRLTKRFLGG